ncbi:hypothetical protein L6452_06477 [Arctium lappa]|uniref:Uncharacterized protein n=1 Tax=Arctium lappa TaxID=4217 RepID=A0ACB9EIU0_ARCLA|nr:hypothetical protein L6452_06477 [Arctium lappa]
MDGRRKQFDGSKEQEFEGKRITLEETEEVLVSERIEILPENLNKGTKVAGESPEYPVPVVEGEKSPSHNDEVQRVGVPSEGTGNAQSQPTFQAREPKIQNLFKNMQLDYGPTRVEISMKSSAQRTNVLAIEVKQQKKGIRELSFAMGNR